MTDSTSGPLQELTAVMRVSDDAAAAFREKLAAWTAAEGGTVKITHVQFVVPGLEGLDLAWLTPGLRERFIQAVAADGVTDVDGLARRTALQLLKLDGTGPSVMQAVRFALYRQDRALKGEKPKDFPYRIDAVRLDGADLRRLLELGVEFIADYITCRSVWKKAGKLQALCGRVDEALISHGQLYCNLNPQIAYPDDLGN